MMSEDPSSDPGEREARQHAAAERRAERRTVEQASRYLTEVMERHKRGEPVLDRMAARIQKRYTDPLGSEES